MSLPVRLQLWSAHVSRSDRIVLAAAAAAVVLAAVAASVLFLPPPADAEGQRAAALVLESAGSFVPQPSADAAGPIVVDVEGGVAAPGVRELPAGSRVADAIAAAGGYAADADLAATAASINLAQPLTDGEQVVVPRIGEGAQAVASAPPAGAASGGVATGGGKVNINTATPEELEALPGIGAVTVQKIVAARQERPFASLEEAVERGVIHNGQLEDIRELATAG
jgi:competence protein ComEA